MNSPFAKNSKKSDCAPVGVPQDKRIERGGWQHQSRIKYDKKEMVTETKQSMGPGQYATTFMGECECEIPDPQNVALSYPTMLARDGYGWTSKDGCNIANDSKLRLGQKITAFKGPKELKTRVFVGTPNLSKGVYYPDVESKLRPGETTAAGRSVNVLSGVSINRFTPMLESLANTIQNPAHIIPEDAHCGWVRGGMSSRNYVRDVCNKQ